jgi:hypothetical protein
MRNALLSKSGLVFPAPHIVRGVITRDNLVTYDQATFDATGAFLVGELERLDQTLHNPLVSVSWQRDIDLREDVTVADEVSSFTISSYGGAGGINPTGKNWISKDANAISGVSVDIGKIAQPLTLWGTEIKYTIPELESAMKLGRPIDQQKYAGMQLKYQMDVDEQVYIGDTGLDQEGLVNSTQVTASPVANGAGGSPRWATKSPDEILADVNTLLNNVWAASGYAVMPTGLRLPPLQFGQIVSQKVSQAGNISVLEYLKNNSLCNATNGKPLDIQPLKWLTGRGTGGTPFDQATAGRMVAYTKDPMYVRYPMTLMARTPLQYQSLYHITTYYCRLGVMEFVYPETLGYGDGI